MNREGRCLDPGSGFCFEFMVRTPFPVSYRHLLVPLLLLLLVTGLKDLFHKKPEPVRPGPPALREAEERSADRASQEPGKSREDLVANDTARKRKEGAPPSGMVPASQAEAEQRGN